MKKTCCLLLLCTLSCGYIPLSAQTLPIDLLPGKAKKALKNFVFVGSGTYVGGITSGTDSLQLGIPTRRSVESFYINRFEVSVGDYQEFVRAMGNPQNHYDSTVWTKDYPYSYNEPMGRNYFWLPNFFAYPIVGITWNQAVQYCDWKTEQLNALLQNSPYRVILRLPSETEWECAALGVHSSGNPESKTELVKDHPIYPWEGLFLLGKKDGQFFTNCNSGPLKTIEGVTILEFPSDGFLYTAPVKSYLPNPVGLYQMAGNVSEWTTDDYARKIQHYEALLDELEDGEKPHDPEFLDKLRSRTAYKRFSEYKIIKGGSWVDGPFYMQTGSFKIQAPDRASCTTGFRPVLIVEKK